MLQRRPASRVFWLALPRVLTSGTFAASCHGVDLGWAASLGLEGGGGGGGGGREGVKKGVRLELT